MRMNKKGFTLVEVLAVITILGIILVIAVPKINNYIDSNKKNTFIVNARNIIRQIEYDNIDFKTFSKIPLNDLDLKEFLNEDIDLSNSVAYSLDDKIYLDLVGTNQYKDLYLCGISNTNKKVDVQETPCEVQNFIYIDFTIDLDGGSTTQNFNTKYISGNYLVLQVPIKTNDTFLGWELVSGNSTLDQNRIKFGTESTKIKAIWGNNPDLVVNLNGGTSSQKFDSKYSGGSLIVLQEPTREGYKFTGWKLVTGNAILSGNVLTIGTTNTVIEATWELNVFNLSVELNGGTSSQKFDSKYSGGSLIVLQEPTREGYKFTGWKLVTGNAILSGNVLTIGTTNTVIEATWELNEFSISYELNGGTLGENAPTTGIAGNSILISNPSKTGYTFKNWDVFGAGSSMSGAILTMGTSNVILVANWEVDSYTISYNLNGGSVEENPTNYTVETDTFTLNNPTKTGYTFKGWLDNVGNELGDFVTISKGSSGDKIYTASWEINTYTISYELDGGTAGSNAPTSGTYGSTVEISNPTRDGYTFAGWSVSETGSTISGTNLTIGAGNVTLTAIWYKLPVLDASYPSNMTILLGNSVTSKALVAIDGNPTNYTYQWYKNGNAVSGATNSSYTFTPSAVSNTTVYCKVTTSAGTVTSRTATITTNKKYSLIPGAGVGGKTSFSATFGGSWFSSLINVTEYDTMIIKGSYGKYKGTMKIGLFTTNTSSAFSTGYTCGWGDPASTISSTTDISSETGNMYFGVYGKQQHEEPQSLSVSLTEVTFMDYANK